MFIQLKRQDSQFEQPSSLFNFGPSQVPIFLIPGILGLPSDILKIGKHLTKAHQHVYAWSYYGSLTNSEHVKDYLDQNLDLASQANQLADAIKQTWERHKLPFIIVGYSYGCYLTKLAAEELYKQGIQPRLLLLDAPSISCSQTYFKTNSNDLTQDLIRIAIYAANAAFGGNQENISFPAVFTEKDNDAIKNKTTLTERFDYIKKIVFQTIDKMINDAEKEQQTNKLAEIKELFAYYLQIANRCLTNLIAHKKIKSDAQLITGVLMTESTAAKYKTDETGDWGNVITQELAAYDHLAIINEKHTATVKFIQTFIEEQIPRQDILNATLKNIVEAATRDQLSIPQEIISPCPSDSDADTEVQMPSVKSPKSIPTAVQKVSSAPIQIPRGPSGPALFRSRSTESLPTSNPDTFSLQRLSTTPPRGTMT